MIRSGSICVSFLYNYLTSEMNIEKQNQSGGDILVKKATKLKCISDTFQSYGGILAKLSQIICVGDNDKNNAVFSDCKPFSSEKTIAFLKNKVLSDPDFFKNVNINYDIYKSGSIGQVHKAIYNDKDIVIKVQYVGLQEQVKSDIFILDTLIKYLYSSVINLSNAMGDIKTKFQEELDYTLEFKNQKFMHNIWNDHPYIKVADLIPELCTDTILSMNFIEGETLSEFIDNSTQEEKNHIGMAIIEFIFTNIYKHNILYSDIHFGNFLIKDKKILYIIDFGCMNHVSDTLVEKFKRLYKSILKNDKEMFFEVVKDLEIIDGDITEDSKAYMYDYFKLQYTPWLEDNFEFSEKWVMLTDRKETELMKNWNLPGNMVYFNKITYTGYHLFGKLNLKGDFHSFYDNLMNI